MISPPRFAHSLPQNQVLIENNGFSGAGTVVFNQP
jgi:hypothetical protein